ncbi:uncharacterized protein [Garra rufa]|uniref:uncharacterized protein n=1 Tax=Garra rufa TaxID=137080 RepID=UPI003CCE93D8
MFPIMSFQRIRRLRVLKFLWLDSWIHRNVPPLTPLCTKANNVKKPVRYTSIKKAKPKTINDIAKLLQQKAKETKEKKQSVITTSALKAATSSTKPTTPNTLNDQSDAKETIFSAKVQTSTTTLPTKDAEDTYSAPDTAVVDTSVDFAFSKDVHQIATEGLHNKTNTEFMNAKDAVPQAVKSAVELAVNAPQETTKINQVSDLSSTNTSEVIPSSEDVASASEKHTAETDETIYMPDVIVTSKDHLQKSFAISEVAAVAKASQDFSQPQFTQSQDFLAPTWSSDVKADKPSSGQKIINQAIGSFSDGTADSILDISSAKAVAVASGEVPILREVSHEETIQVFDPMPDISSPKSTESLPVVKITSVSLSKAVDAPSEMSGDAQTSVSLKDPILGQTDILEEEDQTVAAEEAQLDPIQRLFLDKIREYATKSQASGGLVDAGPEYEKAFSEELTKLQRLYGGGDLTEFPEFKFSEPVLDESSSK